MGVMSVAPEGEAVAPRSEYRVDLWRCARRRWMVAGVLAALALAVLAPRAGAQGDEFFHDSYLQMSTSIGIVLGTFLCAELLLNCYQRSTGALHAQHVRCLPLGYIYYSAGRRGAGAARARVLLVSCAHAALVAPALAVLLLAGTRRSEVHYSLVQGVLISSVGSGCGWLSLALCEDAAAAPATAACYLVSLLTTPLAMILLCGRAVLPAPGAVAGSSLAALAAFGAGAAAARRAGAGPGPRAQRAARLCALALLYMQCCDALQTRGSVRVGDMFAVLLLELSWLAMSLCACWGYARCGLLAPHDARTVALCAVPRAPHAGWQGAAQCAGAALARLPGVLLAPAQALLLAGLAAPCTDALSTRTYLGEQINKHELSLEQTAIRVPSTKYKSDIEVNVIQ